MTSMRLLSGSVLFLTAMALHAQSGDTGYGHWRGQPVTFRNVNGWGIVEGDILLAPIEELLLPPDSKARTRDSIIRAADQFRWTDRTIPYTIDADIPNQQRLADAIQHWNDKSPIRMVRRSNEANYLRFIRQQNNGVCFSTIGMVGGEQTIRVDDTCGVGTLIHEIGHTVGLYHEQSRRDRDQYVTVRYENIDKRRIPDYNHQLNGTAPSGPYDFNSVMHYFAFTGDVYRTQLPAIETIPPGLPIGQRATLSAGDLLAVNRMYKTDSGGTIISSVPEGLRLNVDGIEVTTPITYDWTEGSVHNVEVATRTQTIGAIRYQFANWSDGGDPTHLITVSSDTRLYLANFARQWRITAAASPTAAGSVTLDPPSPDGYYTEGSIVKANVTTNPGYNYRFWTGPITSAHGVSDPNPTFRATSNYNYTAFFTTTAAPVTLLTNPPLVRVIADTLTNTTPYLPNWSINSTHNLSAPSPQQNPSASTRYTFAGWSDNGPQTRNYAITAPTTLTASFNTDHNLSLIADGTGTFSVSPDTTDGFFPEGTTVEITARPGPGFQFVNWIGDLTGTEPSRTIAMTGQRYIVAVFRASNALAFNSSLHAATMQQTGYVAPGQLLHLIGTFAASGAATNTANTRVLFDGKPAEVISVKGNHVIATVPAFVAAQATTVVAIEYNGRLTNGAILQVIDAVPGIFTADESGLGLAAVTHEDGSTNSADNPAPRGSLVTFLTTGAGALADNCTVLINGIPATDVATTTLPDQPPGIIHVTARIPESAPSGIVPISVKYGPFAARQDVSIAIQ